MRRSAIAVAALALLLAAVVVIASAGGTAQGQAKPKVFTVGLVQDVDSFNPLVGVTVAAYEAWNIQYAYLTDKSAKDFSPIPGLALSWTSSPDKRTWTYKLRPNMKWSDGQPLTSEDVAYTINRSRKEQWLNYTSITQNLTARAPDPTTLVVHTSVPDPKLPMIDMYVLPKHVYDKYDAKAVLKYDGQDGVGSGPYVLDKFEKGQFARFKPNPYYYGGKRPLGAVVIRHFNNADAMVAALERGEVDAIENVPGAAFARLQHTKGIATVQGYQGGFDEFALNYGDGLKKGNPALSDPRVRQAIMHAIDKKTLAARGERVRPADRGDQPVGLPGVDPQDPAQRGLQLQPRRGEQDPRRRRLQGHQRRRHPRDARGRQAAEDALRGALRVRDLRADGRVHHGVAAQDRHRHDREDVQRRAADRADRQGRLRHVRVGLDAVRGPRPDAQLLHLQPGQPRPEGPDELLQRRELVRPHLRQALRRAEGRAQQGEAHADRARDAHALLPGRHLRRAVRPA
jgi:hypothetical protein